MENKKIIIDASGHAFGRICSFAAKQALEGSEVVIINSEKAIITGNKKDIIAKYKVLRAKGGFSQKGPKVSKTPLKILKRGVRGMLPDHRKGQGKEAFKRVRCYEGLPEEYKDKEHVKLKTKKPTKFMVLKELSEKL